MQFPRRSGVLLHPTSLPSRYGIGDLGPSAFQFVDFLVSAGQTYWQMLPLSPTGYGDSPYQALSAFAGNPMLISFDLLQQDGLLSAEMLAAPPPFPTDHVDFGWVNPYKLKLLGAAYETFKQSVAPAAFVAFCEAEAHWLDDYALFASLKERFELRPWHEWDSCIASRKPEAVAKFSAELADDIARHKCWQWLFFKQLADVKAYANRAGIQLIGDIPIFVALDSADVWVNTDLFHLDDEFKPTIVSGVPPDFFSETGQLWGHPHYRWDKLADSGYAWWIERFRMLRQQADIIRIDHFRGFYNYWEVSADADTAMNGKWRLGPGADLFRAVSAALSDVPIIAEDLGDFDVESREGVDALQAEFGYPGMKILTAGLNEPDNLFLPHNTSTDYVIYTGTHDNDTVTGWYDNTAEHERDFARRYMAVGGNDIAWDVIRFAWLSVAHTAMTTVQDLLSIGSEGRMNTPGTVGEPNWGWRLESGALNEGIARRLADLTWLYGRLKN